jgi:cobyrinic acid a,c-diamide synthase
MIALMVAGTASGVGKTTVVLTLTGTLRERGYRAHPFKCGPDFLDADHHRAICGRVSRDLDTWMLDGLANRAIFATTIRDVDAPTVEGVMGLYDGVAGGGEDGSTAQIAKILGLPVVLVLDAARSARSSAAVVKGFESFDPALRFAHVELIEDRLLGEKGTKVRGHSFHCSRLRAGSAMPTAYRLKYSLSSREELETYQFKNVLVSYLYFHFRPNPTLANSMVRAARRAQVVEVPA